MEKCSYFIKNVGLFGSFPSQDAVNELEKNGVKYFIDLTIKDEDKTTPYITNHTYINFPIPDRKVPEDRKSFSKFIIKITSIIKGLDDYEKIYIHCKGGHGRSGVVVACLLCNIFNLTPHEALEQTAKYHSKRSVMRDKWRKLGSPQTIMQKTFVCKFFEPLYFYKSYRIGCAAGLSNFSLYSVTIPDFGVFPTAEAAFQAYKCPTDEDYVNQQQQSISPIHSKNIGQKCKLRDDWYKVRVDIMYNILVKKLEQNIDIRENLLTSGLRPIVHQTKYDKFWGDGWSIEGKNVLGKLLTKVRNDFYRNES